METTDRTIKKLITAHFSISGENVPDLPCPEEEILHDYLGDTLASHVRQEVEQHLTYCDRCCETVLAAVELMENAPVSEDTVMPTELTRQLLERIPSGKELSAGNLFDWLHNRIRSLCSEVAGLFSPRRQEFVYVRSSRKSLSENLIVLEKVFKDIRLEIEVEKTGERVADIAIRACHPRTGSACLGVRINLCDETREVASFMVSRGEVLFEKVGFGNYTLLVWHHGKKLGEVFLTIKE